VTLSTLRSLAWTGATILAALLVVVLATQKRALERRVDDLTIRVRDPYPGFVVPEITAETMAGDSLVLGLPDSGSLQLLFLFSTGCKQCEASLPAWNALYTVFETDARIDVIGVSLDSAHVTRTYAADHRLEFPVIAVPHHTTTGGRHENRIEAVLEAGPGGRHQRGVGVRRHGGVSVCDVHAATTHVVRAKGGP
jgi:peroxiredoxin